MMACFGRLVANVLLAEKVFQLIYVDDLRLLALGERKFLVLWMTLFLYEEIGAPFGYHKFAGGLEVQFVGFQLTYSACEIGVAQKRGAWLVEFIQDMQTNRYTVSMRKFGEFLGRLGFLSRVLVWLKAYLSPLYSWSAALDRSTVATALKMVRLVLKFILAQLKGCNFMYSCIKPEY